MADELKLPPGATLVKLPPGATMVDPSPGTSLDATPPVKNLIDDPNLQPFGDTVDTQGNRIPVYKAPGNIKEQLKDIPKGFWEDLVQGGQGLVEGAEGLANTVIHPYQSLTGEKGPLKGLANIGAAQDQVRLKMLDAWKQGDYPAATRHALMYLIPMLGPALDAQGDMAEQGQWGRATGHALSQAGQMAAPELLRGTTIPLSPRLAVKANLNPVEQASQTFLEGQGVDTPLSMQTGNRTIRNLEGSVQNEIGGAGYAQDAREATRQQVRAVADQQLDQVAPGGPVTPEQAGGAVLGKLKRDIRQLDLQSDQSYANAWQIERDPANAKQVPKQIRTQNGWETVEDPATGQPVMESMPLPVDMRPMKMALRPMSEAYARTMAPTQRNASLGLSTMRDILSGPDFKPASMAEKDLGLLKKAARSERGLAELRNESQGLAAFSVGQFQQDIDSTVAGARGGQQAIGELQAGRSSTAKKWGIYEQARKFGSANIEDLEPVAVFNKLTGDKDIRIQFLRRIRAMAPAEMPQVGRGLLQEILDRVFREGDIGHAQEALNSWDAIGPEAKAVLFRNPAQVRDLDNLFVSLKRLAKEPNPSGSGYIIALNRFKNQIMSGLGVALGGYEGGMTGGGLGLVAGQGMYVLSNAALARLLYNPKWTALMRRGIQLQLDGEKVGASLAATQMVKMAGQEAKRLDDQKNRPTP